MIQGRIWKAAIQHLIYLAEPSIGSPLPNESNIGQVADQTTVLLLLPRTLIC